MPVNKLHCGAKRFLVVLFVVAFEYWGCSVDAVEEKKVERSKKEQSVKVGTPAEISHSVVAGMADLQKEKAVRTASQKKLDSHIVLALKKSRGEPPFDKPTTLDPDLVIQADGRVLVDIDAKVTKELLEFISRIGGQVINSFEASRSIRAIVPLARIEAVAGHADIKFISPAVQASTNRIIPENAVSPRPRATTPKP